MRLRYLVFVILLISSTAFSFSGELENRFYGEIDPLLKYRVDIEKRNSGVEKMENMLVKPQGAAARRPGTEYVGSYPGILDFTPCYPTLQELTVAEIPIVPTTPSDTALSSPIHITNQTELAAITGSNHYTIDNDIALTGAWTPIASFSGVLEGNSHVISNLSITSAASSKGLFATLLSNAEIRNLTLDSASLTSTVNVSQLGALVGYINSQNNIVIKNVDVTNSAITGIGRVGGLIGYAYNVDSLQVFNCDITNCDITATWNSGSLIGHLTIKSASSSETNVVRCTATGGSVAGVLGGFFTYPNNMGGLIGYALGGGDYYLVFHSCYSTVDVTTIGAFIIGGFEGYVNYLVKYISCYSTGDVTVNQNNSNSRFSDVGGFMGNESTRATYINCYSTGNITIDAASTSYNADCIYVGGFIGYCDWTEVSNIKRCYSTGNIDITLESDVGEWYAIGGFIGGVVTEDAGGESLLERSFCGGDITINNENGYDPTLKGGIGGFIGTIDGNSSGDSKGLTIQNCYSWSQIISPNNVDEVARSGFIGSVDGVLVVGDQLIKVLNCYDAQTDSKYGSDYTGGIPSGTYAKGFFAYELTADTSTVSNCFWDTTTSSIATSVYGDGHDTDWMMTKSNYEDAGWDFDTIWVICEGDSFDIEGTETIRLIPFEYSTDDAYVLAFGNKYIGFYRSVP